MIFLGSRRPRTSRHFDRILPYMGGQVIRAPTANIRFSELFMPKMSATIARFAKTAVKFWQIVP